jgi:myosin heavy subunit
MSADLASSCTSDFSVNSLKQRLKDRVQAGNIYSGIGHDILLCSNTEDSRFREIHSEGYVAQLKEDHEKSGHPYFLLQEAYHTLLETHQSQSIIFT